MSTDSLGTEVMVTGFLGMGTTTPRRDPADPVQPTCTYLPQVHNAITQLRDASVAGERGGESRPEETQ